MPSMLLQTTFTTDIIAARSRVVSCHPSHFRRDVPFFSLFVPHPGETFAGTLNVPFFEHLLFFY